MESEREVCIKQEEVGKQHLKEKRGSTIDRGEKSESGGSDIQSNVDIKDQEKCSFRFL